MIKTIFFSLALICTASAASYSASYVYRMITGTNTNITVYWYEDYPDLGFIKSYATNAVETYETFCLSNFEAVRWLYQNTETETELLCERKNNLLFFSGKVNGSGVQRIVSIDDKPVYQTISFALTEFLKSEKVSARFWYVVPGEFMPAKMLVRREQGKNIIKVNGVAVEAFELDLSLDGPLRNFWKGTFWFRTFDGLYVRYEGVNGFPGTPVTVVELIGEE